MERQRKTVYKLTPSLPMGRLALPTIEDLGWNGNYNCRRMERIVDVDHKTIGSKEETLHLCFFLNAERQECLDFVR